MKNKTKLELIEENERLVKLSNSLLQKNLKYDEILAKFNTIITIQNLAFTNRHLGVEIPQSTLMDISVFFEEISELYMKDLEGENV